MPRLGASFFTKGRSGAGTSPCSLSHSLASLHESCTHQGSHPFVRSFATSLTAIEEALCGTSAPFPVVAAMEAFAEFLRPSLDPAARVTFPIAARDKAAQFMDEVGGVLEILAEMEENGESSAIMRSTLPQWHQLARSFIEQCEELWELYVYLVFLDVKGDRVLVEQTIGQLCSLLDCSAQSLTFFLASTRPWAEMVFKGLASRSYEEILKSMHKRSLQQWHLSHAHKMKAQSESDNNLISGFWERCFNRTCKVAWSDFLDAFHVFCGWGQGACPTDVDNELHKMIDPSCGHCVTRWAWSCLLEKHPNPETTLIQAALEGIFEDISASIYRSDGDLPSLEDMQSAQRPNNTLATMSSASPSTSKEHKEHKSEHRHRKSQKDKAAPLTAGSQSIMAAPIEPPAAGSDPSNCVTPPDRHNKSSARSTSGSDQKKCTWDEYLANLAARPDQHAWWCTSGEQPNNSLRIDALRAVKSNLLLTNQALALHIVSGDLANQKPILQVQRFERVAANGKGGADGLPTIVVLANSGRTNGVTTFGRGANHGISQPDHAMADPIASRLHFSITFDEAKQRYCLSDSGSKWGTFMHIDKPHTLKCGDWIRAGVAEFVVRFCGGSCSSHKRHAQHRVRSLRLSREYGRGVAAAKMAKDVLSEVSAQPGSSQGSRSGQLQDELALLLSSRPLRGWTSTSARLAQDLASLSPRPVDDQEVSSNLKEFETLVPTTPLELEFVSGPRMGEKVTLWDRLSTLGRADSNTVQISDIQVQNVSRVHCIFQYVNNRWQIQDNKSTNGTWRRLSCTLEPSVPLPLEGGEVFLAANHEFAVAPLPAGNCPPSVTSVALTSLGGSVQPH